MANIKGKLEIEYPHAKGNFVQSLEFELKEASDDFAQLPEEVARAIKLGLNKHPLGRGLLLRNQALEESLDKAVTALALAEKANNRAAEEAIIETPKKKRGPKPRNCEVKPPVKKFGGNQ